MDVLDRPGGSKNVNSSHQLDIGNKQTLLRDLLISDSSKHQTRATRKVNTILSIVEKRISFWHESWIHTGSDETFDLIMTDRRLLDLFLCTRLKF